MHKQKSITQFSLLLIFLLVAFSVLGAFFYHQRLNGVTSTALIRTTKPYTPIAPSPLPSAMPIALPVQSESSPCNCSWAITGGTTVEFLITSPSGQQEGYLQASNSYVNNIPDASYGIEGGIADDTGQGSPPSAVIYFGMNNPENGIYELQVIGKQPGKYHLDVSIVWGPMNGKKASIDGTLITNEVEKYTITFPGGTIQKLGH